MPQAADPLGRIGRCSRVGGRELVLGDEAVILLVEDDPDDVVLTLRTLKKNHVRNEVVVTRDGAEALDYLFATGEYEGRDLSVMPQVVLLDLKLPKVDGLEVLRRLRSEERTRRLPVVILTGSSDERGLVDGHGLGANGYIRKPVDIAQLRAAARQLGLYWVVLNEVPRR